MGLCAKSRLRIVSFIIKNYKTQNEDLQVHYFWRWDDLRHLHHRGRSRTTLPHEGNRCPLYQGCRQNRVGGSKRFPGGSSGRPRRRCRLPGHRHRRRLPFGLDLHFQLQRLQKPNEGFRQKCHEGIGSSRKDGQSGRIQGRRRTSAEVPLQDWKDFELYAGESMNTDGTVGYLNYEEDGVTPYMLFWKHSLVEEKC